MKKILTLSAMFFGLLMTQYGYAQDSACCPEEKPVGECYCLYARYEPCYSNCWKCVEEQVPCTKKCCRMVPKYYECQKCRYVPQYYTETRCKYVPEYYNVEECKTSKKWVCEKKCTYVPKYYWKHSCQPTCDASVGCAAQPAGVNDQNVGRYNKPYGQIERSRTEMRMAPVLDNSAMDRDGQGVNQ